jgi:hypothetical protein
MWCCASAGLELLAYDDAPVPAGMTQRERDEVILTVGYDKEMCCWTTAYTSYRNARERHRGVELVDVCLQTSRSAPIQLYAAAQALVH